MLFNGFRPLLQATRPQDGQRGLVRDHPDAAGRGRHDRAAAGPHGVADQHAGRQGRGHRPGHRQPQRGARHRRPARQRPQQPDRAAAPAQLRARRGPQDASAQSIVGIGDLTDATAGLLTDIRPALRTDIAKLGALAKNLDDNKDDRRRGPPAAAREAQPHHRDRDLRRLVQLLPVRPRGPGRAARQPASRGARDDAVPGAQQDDDRPDRHRPDPAPGRSARSRATRSRSSAAARSTPPTSARPPACRRWTRCASRASRSARSSASSSPVTTCVVKMRLKGVRARPADPRGDQDQDRARPQVHRRPSGRRRRARPGHPHPDLAHQGAVRHLAGVPGARTTVGSGRHRPSWPPRSRRSPTPSGAPPRTSRHRSTACPGCRRRSPPATPSCGCCSTAPTGSPQVLAAARRRPRRLPQGHRPGAAGGTRPTRGDPHRCW